MTRSLTSAAIAGALALISIPAMACDPIPGALIGGGIGAAIGNAPGAAVGAIIGSTIAGSAPCHAYGEPRYYGRANYDRGYYEPAPAQYAAPRYDDRSYYAPAPAQYVERRYDDRAYYAAPPARVYYQPAPVYYAPPPAYYYAPAVAALAVSALLYPRYHFGRPHLRRWR
jgi:hypothetical protein